MSTFDKLQSEVGEWSSDNFPGQPDVNPFLGSSEEVGELAEDLNLEEDPTSEELDAVGDIVVYLADFCYIRGLSLEECYKMRTDINNKHNNFFREWVASRGQLSRSVLKQRQGIRLDEDRVGTEAEKKSLSRMLGCLDEFAEDRGYTLEEAIEYAWYDEVIDREWESSYQEE